MRKRRFFYWTLFMVVAAVVFGVEGTEKEEPKEKAPIYVYAPEDMETAFSTVLGFTELKSDYEIVMTDDKQNANVIVENGKEFDPTYTKIAFSPFVVAHNPDGQYTEELKASGVLSEAFFNNDYYEIDVLKVIEEVIGEGKWENFGIEDMGDIKVFYPHEDTPYWSDFYDFMLVTVNGGKYPTTENELRNAVEKIRRFEASNYTEAVKDFDERFVRNGGFQGNTFFFIPEKLCTDLAEQHSKKANIFYPLMTVYFNYYIKVDKIGSVLVQHFEDESFFTYNFYGSIKFKEYRSSAYLELESFSAYLYGERDVYNVLHLDKDRIILSDLKATS